jgi:hypothetical protein
VTIYAVDVDRLTHTCPADPQPHPYDTRRTIVHITPGGACRQPVTIRSGDQAVVIACGRVRPADQQCGACKTIVVEHAVTAARFRGHHGAEALIPAAVPVGLAAEPCASCGRPLAAVLARRGRHLLCPLPRKAAAR